MRGPLLYSLGVGGPANYAPTLRYGSGLKVARASLAPGWVGTQGLTPSALGGRTRLLAGP